MEQKNIVPHKQIIFDVNRYTILEHCFTQSYTSIYIGFKIQSFVQVLFHTLYCIYNINLSATQRITINCLNKNV